MDDGLDTPKTVMTTKPTRQIFLGQQDGLQVTTKLSSIFLQQGIFPAEILIQEIHAFSDKKYIFVQYEKNLFVLDENFVFVQDERGDFSSYWTSRGPDGQCLLVNTHLCIDETPFRNTSAI